MPSSLDPVVAPHLSHLRVPPVGADPRFEKHCIFFSLVFTVKKKYSAGLKFSNLMNIGKKKPSSLETPEKGFDTSGEDISVCVCM